MSSSAMTFFHGAGFLALALLLDCDAVGSLKTLLLTIGGLLIASSFTVFYLGVGYIDSMSDSSTSAGVGFNVLHLAIGGAFIWLTILVWGERDRLWDGGENCDGFLFSFVFIYTLVMMIEAVFLFCYLLTLRRAAQSEEISIV